MATTPTQVSQPQAPALAAQQAILNGLLRLGIESIPLHEQLEGALDEILAIPWLPLDPTAAIFLTGEEPEVLELAVERNLPPEFCHTCRRVPFGHCHCGRAAAARTTQFAACVDDRHETRYDGILPHGHYSLPLLHGERLLGVLTLYLPDGHTPAEGEAAFLEAVANAVAKLIAHVRVEEELVAAMERAGEANRTKSAFLAVLGHEIRTPFNGVLGMLDILLESDLAEEQERCARTARTSAATLLTLLNDCLDLAQADTGKLEMEQRELDPLAVLATALDVVAPLAMEKGVEVVALAEGDLPATVAGDEVRLRRVLVNLLGNAVKFTESRGEVVVEVGSKRVEDGGALLYVAVRDTGIGIAPEVVPHIFGSFVQADSSNTREHGGSGLGLAICRRLVEHMGGRIEVTSTPGEGSTFRFTARVADPSSPHPLPADLATTQILVTPPGSATTTAVAEQLRRWGGTVVWAASLDNLMAVVEHGLEVGHPADLLVVDGDHTSWLAPLYPRLAALPPAARPAILELGWGGMAAATGAGPLPIHRLPKPFHPGALHAALVDLLDGEPVCEPRPPVAAGESPVAAPARILIAEDNVVNQRIMAHMVRQLGHQAVVVANGAEAVAAVAEGGIDLVLMDHQMPVMAGDEATARIRAAEPPGRHIPILGVTATALESTREECLRVGMDVYRVKPIHREVLAACLDQWLPEATPDGQAGYSDGGVGRPCRKRGVRPAGESQGGK